MAAGMRRGACLDASGNCCLQAARYKPPRRHVPAPTQLMAPWPKMMDDMGSLELRLQAQGGRHMGGIREECGTRRSSMDRSAGIEAASTRGPSVEECEHKGSGMVRSAAVVRGESWILHVTWATVAAPAMQLPQPGSAADGSPGPAVLSTTESSSIAFAGPHLRARTVMRESELNSAWAMPTSTPMPLQQKGAEGCNEQDLESAVEQHLGSAMPSSTPMPLLDGNGSIEEAATCLCRASGPTAGAHRSRCTVRTCKPARQRSAAQVPAGSAARLRAATLSHLMPPPPWKMKDGRDTSTTPAGSRAGGNEQAGGNERAGGNEPTASLCTRKPTMRFHTNRASSGLGPRACCSVSLGPLHPLPPPAHQPWPLGCPAWCLWRASP